MLRCGGKWIKTKLLPPLMLTSSCTTPIPKHHLHAYLDYPQSPLLILIRQGEGNKEPYSKAPPSTSEGNCNKASNSTSGLTHQSTNLFQYTILRLSRQLLASPAVEKLESPSTAAQRGKYQEFSTLLCPAREDIDDRALFEGIGMAKDLFWHPIYPYPKNIYLLSNLGIAENSSILVTTTSTADILNLFSRG